MKILLMLIILACLFFLITFPLFLLRRKKNISLISKKINEYLQKYSIPTDTKLVQTLNADQFDELLSHKELFIWRESNILKFANSDIENDIGIHSIDISIVSSIIKTRYKHSNKEDICLILDNTQHPTEASKNLYFHKSSIKTLESLMPEVEIIFNGY